MSIAPTTETLESLFAWLDGLPGRPDIDALKARLERLEFNPDDYAEFVRFNDHHYMRNLVHQGPHYHALFLCWKSGQRSPIHDHAESVCGVRVLKGLATETRFEISPSGLLRPLASDDHPVGAVCASVDSDIHQVSNLQADGIDLVTLHIYAPPLLAMKSFSITDRMVGEFRPAVHEFLDGGGI